MAGANTSSAVMAQRVEPPDSLDFFPTPPWATRALCRRLESSGLDLAGMEVWEPAAGRALQTKARRFVDRAIAEWRRRRDAQARAAEAKE